MQKFLKIGLLSLAVNVNGKKTSHNKISEEGYWFSLLLVYIKSSKVVQIKPRRKRRKDVM